jgi:hypothetical protein
MTLAPDVVTHDAPNKLSPEEQYQRLVDAGVSEERARELAKPQVAYDPDSTPNALTAEVGMDQVVLDAPPIAPMTVGETFTDADGSTRTVPAPENGGVVGVKAQHPKPWLEVQGHGKRSDEEHAAHDDAQAGDSAVDGGTS